MGTAERRRMIMRVLCRRGHETISNLAVEFGVSERTIRRDIETLSLSEPVYTQQRRYGGGVYVMNGHRIDQQYMSSMQTQVIEKVIRLAYEKQQCVLQDEELHALQNLVETFAYPHTEI
ncbi:MAG: DeoR family transcriptional regulator [Clostridiales bacterium]|jgi:DeoR/GlpR family transcriptional regulator of sugar metabolism|nr:DeoR family transcriptional regulator [Clostridiales bacterium]